MLYYTMKVLKIANCLSQILSQFFCGQIRCCRGLMLWVAFVKVLRKRRFAYDKVVASLESTLIPCFGEGEALF